MKLTRKYKKSGGGSGMSIEEQKEINEINELKIKINDKETQLQKMKDEYKKAIGDGEYSRYNDVNKILHVLMNPNLWPTTA